MFETIFIMAISSALSSAVLGLYLKRTLPKLISKVGEKVFEKTQEELPGILEDVGVSVGTQLVEQFNNMIQSPNMKRAMSILGKHSGQARADDALRNKVADKVLDGSPLVKKVLDYFDVTPIEGLQLINDPLFRPLIQGFMNKSGSSQFNSPNSKTGFGTKLNGRVMS